VTIQSAGGAFRAYVDETLRAARSRLAGAIGGDMSSYGHAVALTKYAGLLASLAERTCRWLGWKRSRASMIRAARAVHQEVEPLIARGQRQSACRKGCFFCCCQPVEASLPEVLLLADHLRRSLSPHEMTALRMRIDAYEASLRAEPDHGALCPLNVAGACSVYEARPLLCRGFNALDVTDCEAWSREGRTRPIRYVGDPVAIARAADLALQLATRFHFPAERVSGLPLVPALRYALDHPAECGERAFLEAM
jgi:hypothetical protein